MWRVDTVSCNASIPSARDDSNGTAAIIGEAIVTKGGAGIAIRSEGTRGGGAYAVNWNGETTL